jgi:hypothetical protein
MVSIVGATANHIPLKYRCSNLHFNSKHLPSSWLIAQATLLSRYLAEQGFDTRYRFTTMWKASWGLFNWETHDNPTPSNIACDDFKEAFLSRGGM